MRVHRRDKEENRKAKERSSKKTRNTLKSKIAQDHSLCLWPIKRLEV